MKMPEWFRQWLVNDYSHLVCKVNRIGKLQWAMIGAAIAVPGVALPILAQYTFR